MERSQPRLHGLRALALLAGTGGLTATGWSLAGEPLHRLATALSSHSGQVTFPDVLEAAAALTATACGGWLFLTAALVCVEVLLAPASGLLPRGGCVAPQWLRGAVVAGGGAALGVTLVGAPATAAGVGDVPAPVAALAAAPVAVPVTPGAVSGLPVPDRTTGVRPAHRPAVTDHARTPAARYTVVAGDSLWRIASRLVPPNGTAADVAAACRTLHRANRDRIGPDRDLIFPGTTLQLPAPHTSGKDRS